MANSYNNSWVGGTELRKLTPKFRLQISQILDVNNSWKHLMSSIPSERNPTLPKYTNEHIELIERVARTNSKSPTEILLDEWSTSGQNRPKIETLYELLQKCNLYRAADYIAGEILDIALPQRPTSGPAALIDEPESLDSETIKLVNDLNENCNIGPEENDNQNPNYKTLLEKLNNYDYSSGGNPIDFNLDVIEGLTEKFDSKFKIGSGAFGTVYVLDLYQICGGPKLAIKLLHPSTSVMEDQFITEIQVLSKYRHENLVPLIGFCTRGPNYCLVYEFMSNGSLLEAIENQNPILDWSQRLKIAQGIIRGINYLHSAMDKPLIHRDIKSANILLSSEYIPKIGDFGLAKSFNNSTQTSALASTIFGTSAYMAPEAFRGDISPKMDVFSYGVIILELLTGLSPFDETRTEGNDIVTYLEEIVHDQDDGILPYLDQSAGIVLDPGIIATLYSISMKCLAEKRRRPTSDLVLNELEVLNQRFSLYQNQNLL